MKKPQLLIDGRYFGTWKHEGRRHQQHFNLQEKVFLDAGNLVRSIPDKVREIRNSPDLSDTGKTKAIREWIASTIAPQLKQAADVVRAAESYANNKRAGLQVNKGDKTDVVGALVRKDIRDRFEKMDVAKRNAVLTMPDLDPVTALAITEAPAWLSGVTQEQHARLQQRALLAQNPEAGQELVDLEDAHAAVARGLRAVAMVVKKETGMAQHQLDEIMGGPTLRQIISSMPGLALEDDEGDEGGNEGQAA